MGAVEIDNSGPPFGGNSNGFLQRYDIWGNLVSELPFGEPKQSEANAVYVDATGVYTHSAKELGVTNIKPTTH